MNKIALVAGAVLALSLVTAPVALAADDDSCDAARKVLVKAQVRVDDRAAQERVEELAEFDAAKVALNAAQVELDVAVGLGVAADIQIAREARNAARDVRDRAQTALDTDSKRLAELRVLLTVAIGERDKACDETPPTTTPTPVPTTPADADVDCDEVTDARAQEILDADRSDPNNLDDDNDGVACEEHITINNDVVVTPSGGVNTGGGPA